MKVSFQLHAEAALTPRKQNPVRSN